MQEIRAISPNIGLGFAGTKASASGMSRQRAQVKRRQWRVQGTREEHHVDARGGAGYDTFCWKVLENEFSEDSVPRHLRTGMVVYLPSSSASSSSSSNETTARRDFWVDVSVQGTLRGLRSKHSKVRERRWFEPTSAQRESRDALDDDDVLRKMVREENTKIAGLVVPVPAAEETGPAFPALPACAAAGVDVSAAKPAAAATKPTGQMDGVASYDILEMDSMVHALAADEVIALPA